MIEYDTYLSEETTEAHYDSSEGKIIFMLVR